MDANRRQKRQESSNKEGSLIRSSAAEYLTFVAATGKGGVEVVYADESIWLTQKMMGVLYDVETHTINYHLKKVFADSELEEDAVIRNFRIGSWGHVSPFFISSVHCLSTPCSATSVSSRFLNRRMLVDTVL